MINVENLSRNYITYKRAPTMGAAIKSILNREKICVKAVQNLSFKLEKGSLMALIGPNGAGKSTLIKMLTGILYPTSGNAQVMGYIPWKDRIKYVEYIGAVFGQKSQLIWDIPPSDAFALNKVIYQIPTQTFNKNKNRLCEMLDVADVINRPTRQLSLGQRMKCEFIIAMLHNPSIVFLDEPTIGLDVVAKQNIREFIKEINNNGTTIILTTHDLSDVEELAEKVMVINQGEIVYWDKLKNLYQYLKPIKIIKLRTYNSIDLNDLSGIEITTTVSDNEVELNLSLDKMSLNEFISRVNKTSDIADMEIKQEPIESIIMQLYNKRTNL